MLLHKNVFYEEFLFHFLSLALKLFNEPTLSDNESMGLANECTKQAVEAYQIKSTFPVFDCQ